MLDIAVLVGNHILGMQRRQILPGFFVRQVLLDHNHRLTLPADYRLHLG